MEKKNTAENTPHLCAEVYARIEYRDGIRVVTHPRERAAAWRQLHTSLQDLHPPSAPRICHTHGGRNQSGRGWEFSSRALLDLARDEPLGCVAVEREAGARGTA